MWVCNGQRLGRKYKVVHAGSTWTEPRAKKSKIPWHGASVAEMDLTFHSSTSPIVRVTHNAFFVHGLDLEELIATFNHVEN